MQANILMQKENNNSSINNNEPEELQIKNYAKQQAEEIEKQYTSTHQYLKHPFMFWFMIIHGGFFNFIISYNMGLFNILFDNIEVIYDWNQNEKLLYCSLINSLPQGMAAIVSLFAGNWASKYGRRKLLIAFNYLAIIATLIIVLGNTVALIIGRIIIGLCFGVWSSIGPLYSIEVACKKYKGTSGIIYSLQFGIGIMISFLLSYGLKYNHFWKIILGLPIVLSFLSNLIFHFVFTHETPQFYIISKSDAEKAKQVIYSRYQEDTAKEEFEDLHLYQQQYYKVTNKIGYRDLFRPRYLHRTILIIFFTMAFCYSGINVISIYSYSIIEVHQSPQIAQLFTSIMPVGDIIGPFLAIILINRLGRKRLYLLGLFLAVVFLLLFSTFGWTDLAYLQKYMILAYKFVLGMSSCPVHWTFPSEILPPIGIGFFSFAYWVFSLTSVLTYPYMQDYIGVEYSMLSYAVVTIILIIVLQFIMHDTTNKGKDDIEKLYNKLLRKNKQDGYQTQEEEQINQLKQ